MGSNTQAQPSSARHSRHSVMYELYRNCSLGQALTDALDDVAEAGLIEPELALYVLKQFDRSVNEALSTQVTARVNIAGDLHYYRFCNNVWTFIIKNAVLRSPGSVPAEITADRVKIVACDGRISQQAAENH